MCFAWQKFRILDIGAHAKFWCVFLGVLIFVVFSVDIMQSSIEEVDVDVGLLCMAKFRILDIGAHAKLC